MNAADAIQRIASDLASSDTLRCLLLGGSHGTGTADAFSDLDFVALVAPPDHDRFVEHVRSAMEREGEVVLWRDRPAGSGRLVNVVLANAMRIDVFVCVSLAGRFSDEIRVLHDPNGAAGVLSQSASFFDPAEYEWLAEEFVRILALAPVAAGRGEWVLAVDGVGHLRNLFVRLLRASRKLPEGGVLHPSRGLNPRDRRAIATLPCPRAECGEVLAANEEMLTRFAALCEEVEVRLPERFLQTALGRLRQAFPGAFEAERETSAYS